jgi:hypothetical protein
VFLCLAAIMMLKFKPAAFKNITYQYTNWGVERLGEGLAFSAQWNKFIKLVETKQFLFVYLNESNAHVIQKRMFKDQEEMDELRQFIAQKISSK